MKRILSIFILCSFVFTGLAFAKGASQYIRVLILKDVKECDLYIRGKYEIRSLETNAILLSSKGLKTKITLSNKSISIKGKLYATDVIIIPGAKYFHLNNRPLRGSLIISKDKASKLSAINYLNLEDYVKGVLFHEVSHRWPLESLKAQAVATRTYALYQASVNKDKAYDVRSDMYSQVYGGKDSERYRTNKATILTKGLVLNYKDKLFPAYFHATCGGNTEDADALWNINLPVLKGVECTFCKASPHFSWEKKIQLLDITKKLSNSGSGFGILKDIKILDRNSSGRVKTLILEYEAGQEEISAKDFRQLLGPKDIRSLNFNIEIDSKNAYFSGFGWGHGVGLCQWGAYFMSKKGYKYRTILGFYYQDAEIKKIY